MSQIVFAVRLAEADWEPALRGWRCPALNIPAATIQDIFIDGQRADRAFTEVLAGQAVIRWIPADRPKRVLVIIAINEELSLSADTDKWKKLAIVLPVFATITAAIISAGATYLVKEPKPLTASILNKAPAHIKSIVSQLSREDTLRLINLTSSMSSKGGESQSRVQYAELIRLGLAQEIPVSELDTSRFGYGVRISPLGHQVQSFLQSAVVWAVHPELM